MYSWFSFKVKDLYKITQLSNIGNNIPWAVSSKRPIQNYTTLKHNYIQTNTQIVKDLYKITQLSNSLASSLPIVAVKDLYKITQLSNVSKEYMQELAVKDLYKITKLSNHLAPPIFQ